MATSRRYVVKLAEEDYKILKQLATDRRQDLLVVLGDAINDLNEKHKAAKRR